MKHKVGDNVYITGGHVGSGRLYGEITHIDNYERWAQCRTLKDHKNFSDPHHIYGKVGDTWRADLKSLIKCDTFQNQQKIKKLLKVTDE